MNAVVDRAVTQPLHYSIRALSKQFYAFEAEAGTGGAAASGSEGASLLPCVDSCIHHWFNGALIVVPGQGVCFGLA